MSLRIVIVGLTITSSWGNGHATTYRGLVRALEERGHRVLFLEHDKPYYADHRDLPHPPYGRTALYRSVEDLQARFRDDVRDADVVIVGSYVPEGVRVARWACDTARGVKLFYDIDTPVTLAKLERGDHEYLHPDLVPRFEGYLSFTGGPTLDRLVRRWGARRAWPLYCSVDPDLYHPQDVECTWDLGYLGTYSADRQPPLERLMLAPARAWRGGRFVVAGPMYPADVAWPSNVLRIEHLPPAEHRAFYSRQRFTLNLTRADMAKAGHSPSVRLFEAAACGVPIISDPWDGLDTIFRPDAEILVSRGPEDTTAYVREMDEARRRRIGEAARRRVLASHTAGHRALELETIVHTLQKEIVRDA